MSFPTASLSSATGVAGPKPHSAKPLLTNTEADGTVDLIDTATLERLASVGGGPAALAVDFSPDGRLLAVSGDHGRVRLWDVRTRREVGELRGLRAWSQAIAFSPDGRLLAGSEVNTAGRSCASGTSGAARSRRSGPSSARTPSPSVPTAD
jgi:WD40 repeat protein